MDKIKKYRQYFVIIFYVISLLGITIYLHFENSKEPEKNEQTVTEEYVPEVQSSEVAVEDAEETEMVIVEEEPIEQFLDEEVDFLDNREEKFATNIKTIGSHRLIAENEDLRLFLDDKTLSIIIQDAQNGAVMYSTVEKPVKSNVKWESFVQSAVVIEYLVDNNIVYNQVDMIQGNPEIELIKTGDGFNAQIHYPELEIQFDLIVALDQNNLIVEVPKDSIEEKSDHYKIGNMYVYPMLGYSKLAEVSGFMFIPDGSGATIKLADNNGKYRQPYSEMIYGSNLGLEDPYVLSELYGMVTTEKPYDILFPVFGMMHEDKQFGFIGMIEEGDVHSRIEAYPSGAILPYNWITGKYIFRQFYTQATSQSSGTITQRQKNRNDISVKIRYSFMRDDHANLFGMASTYRNYLIDRYKFETQPTDFSVRLDFLGNDIENGLLNYQQVVMSTFEEIGEAITNLTSKGVTSQFIGLFGWQKDGESGATYSNNFEVSNLLGGLSGLEQLSAALNDTSKLYLHDHPLRYTPSMIGINSVTMDKINRKQFSEYTGEKVISSYQYLAPEEAVSRLRRKLDHFNTQLNFMISGIGQYLFSYYKNNQDYDRVHTRMIFEEAIATISNERSLVLNQPIQPYWQYIDSMINVPLDSSGYIFEDESVPFLPLVLRGLVPLYSEYLNFESNYVDFLLKMVETGVQPSYFLTINNSSLLHNTNYAHVYTSMFSDYEESLVDLYQELDAINEKVKTAEIIAYQKDKGLARVEYDNHIVIYVNHNGAVAEMDGIQLEPKSYKVVEK